MLYSFLKIGDQVFLHCQLGLADHSAPGALDEPMIAFFGASHSSRPCVGGRLWHASQQGLRQSVKVSEKRLLCPRNAEHILSHLA
jgi:hypothetical protein